MRGRPRKPAALKALAGNPGKRPIPEHELNRKVALPRPPRHLDPMERAAWRSVGKILVERNVVTAGDGLALEAVCVAYAEWRRARQVLRKEGTTYEIRSREGHPCGMGTRPEVGQAADAWRRLVSGLSHFGLTPATAGKVAPLGKQDPEDEREAVIASLIR